MNPLKRALAEDRPVLGLQVTTPSVHLVQNLARTGLDCVLIDLEHGSIDITTAHAMVAATAGTDCAPLVRVATSEPWLCKAALDTGVFGLAFPMVTDRAKAEASVRAIRYPPAGERGWGPYNANARWGLSMAAYREVANSELLAMIFIEHIEAVRRLDEILAVPGIDAALIAPYDMSFSLGVAGQRDHPDLLAAITEAEDKILASPVALAGAAVNAEEANAKIARGYRMIFVGEDSTMMHQAVVAALEGIER